MSLAAYQKTSTIIEQPRDTERRLLNLVTGRMISARDSGLKGVALMPVLHHNREVWTAFSSACGARGNELPQQLRASIISLAIWVDKFTSDVIAGREPIDDLIDVNCTMIEGLAS
ncbi:flagellar FlaF family protein [Pacificimonas flava]|uniref:Flagellar FlaF family protein n=2 Tax=Pacificimonas TaxID=1960290 RepID=A0A219B711_9SPHN|nr:MULTISPECIES: flagellar biosynthesis regulator FlaF [Pacificimonas]MBZ6379200.1 flagellar biosynthesis regulator FlaF [Pacificimonas aurantium]OWV33579.1 flagellar FlaF family protein [Pacificimonas flava]